MTSEQKYFHDRIVLLLLSISTFVVVLASLLILLRLDSGRNEGYIVQYRTNLGITAYKAGSASELVAFIVFMVAVLAINTFISMKVYDVHRQFSITVLSMGVLLFILAFIVSNALLVLR
jgi:hypothetical protein